MLGALLLGVLAQETAPLLSVNDDQRWVPNSVLRARVAPVAEDRDSLSKGTHSTVEINLDFVSTSTAEMHLPAPPTDEPPVYIESESTVGFFVGPEDSLASSPHDHAHDQPEHTAMNVGAEQGAGHSKKAYCSATTYC